jgi:transcriptional regulator with XRE-family HTH domain
MKKHSMILGKLLERRRGEKGLTRKDVASGLGFSNLGKWIWRIEQMENGHFKNPDFLSRVCDLLEVTELDLKRCEKEEEEKLRQYINSLPPFKPHIVRRFTACVYGKISVPDHIKPYDLLNYASNLACELKSELCVRLNYDLCYWVGIDGSHKKETNPTTTPRSVISFSGEAK